MCEKGHFVISEQRSHGYKFITIYDLILDITDLRDSWLEELIPVYKGNILKITNWLQYHVYPKYSDRPEQTAQQAYNVATTSIQRQDVESTLFQRYVPAGPDNPD